MNGWRSNKDYSYWWLKQVSWPGHYNGGIYNRIYNEIYGRVYDRVYNKR